jgi:hypothetical protein
MRLILCAAHYKAARLFFLRNAYLDRCVLVADGTTEDINIRFSDKDVVVPRQEQKDYDGNDRNKDKQCETGSKSLPGTAFHLAPPSVLHTHKYSAK